MKKYLALALAFSAASVAHAQDSGGFRIGVKVGGTYSNINGRDSEKITGTAGNIKYKPGFNAGLAFTIPVTDDGFASFAPEIIVNRKGYTNSSTVDNPGGNIAKVESEYNRALTYIDVPLLFKINTGGLFFELGPQVGYMARSSQEIEVTTKYNDGTTKDKFSSNTSDSKEDLASFDIGGVAGLGYQTEGGLSIGIRYNQGVKTLFDSKNVNGKDEDRAFNSAYMLQVGYLLPLGK